jgi:hypothetical protein
MSTSITIFLANSLRDPTPESERTEAFTYTTLKEGEQAASEAFNLFNAPESTLSEDDLKITRAYREHHLRSLSVGDVVSVAGVRYYCDMFGWKILEDVA